MQQNTVYLRQLVWREQSFSMPKYFCNDAAASAARGDSHAHGHALTIGAVAQMFKVSVLTLRLYEWRGLVRRHKDRGERVYSWSDCERIALIVKTKKAKVALRQIAPLLKAMDRNASRAAIKAGQAHCLALITNIKKYDDAVADLLAELDRISWELSTRLAATVADPYGERAPVRGRP
jgi:DNA-binding transcriptional MerR regulator